MTETKNSKECTRRLAEFSSQVRKRTLKRLQEVPKGFMNWQLNNTAMSFADIVQHLINADELFFNILAINEKRFQWKLGTEEPHIQIDKSAFETMVDKLEKFQTKRHRAIYILDDSAMNEKVIDENSKKSSII